MSNDNLTDNQQRCELDNKDHIVHHPKKKHELLSEQDLNELMGVSRDRYHRVKGRVKRK